MKAVMAVFPVLMVVVLVTLSCAGALAASGNAATITCNPEWMGLDLSTTPWEVGAVEGDSAYSSQAGGYAVTNTGSGVTLLDEEINLDLYLKGSDALNGDYPWLISSDGQAGDGTYGLGFTTDTPSQPVAGALGVEENVAWGEWADYRKPIKIVNNSGEALTDYQVEVTLDTQGLISEGKLQDDADDLVFRLENGGDAFPYWIESGINTGETQIWVKVPSIPIGESTLYVYYGDPQASATGSFEDTFPFGTFSGDYAAWAYRRPIEITETSGSKLEDYQALVLLEADGFDYTETKEGGDDLRFVTTEGTACDYWIETWETSGESRIWVEVPELAASAKTTLYMYYGNDEAEPLSSGPSALMFCDDFGDVDLWEYPTASEAGWVSPDSHYKTPSSDWKFPDGYGGDPAGCYDDDIHQGPPYPDINDFDADSHAYIVSAGPEPDDYLELSLDDPILCNKVRIQAVRVFGSLCQPTLTVKVYYDGAWQEIFSGTLPSGTWWYDQNWYEIDIGSTQLVEKARITTGIVGRLRVFEFDFWETTTGAENGVGGLTVDEVNTRLVVSEVDRSGDRRRSYANDIEVSGDDQFRIYGSFNWTASGGNCYVSYGMASAKENYITVDDFLGLGFYDSLAGSECVLMARVSDSESVAYLWEGVDHFNVDYDFVIYYDGSTVYAKAWDSSHSESNPSFETSVSQSLSGIDFVTWQFSNYNSGLSGSLYYFDGVFEGPVLIRGYASSEPADNLGGQASMGAWADSFGGTAGFSYSSNVTVSDGEVSLSDYKDKGTVKSVAVNADDSLRIAAGVRFTWSDTKPEYTEITYQLEYYDSGWRLVPNSDLPGNSEGFTTEDYPDGVDLSSLCPDYGQLRLRANLSRSSNESPSIQDWSLTYYYRQYVATEPSAGTPGTEEGVTWDPQDDYRKYRKPVTLNNWTGQELTNHPVKLTVNTSELVSAGKLQSDGDDIRITQSDGQGLAYWIQSGIDSTSTVIWVNLPSLPVGETTVYLYYGNPDVSGSSSESQTFPEGTSSESYSEAEYTYEAVLGTGLTELVQGLGTDYLQRFGLQMLTPTDGVDSDSPVSTTVHVYAVRGSDRVHAFGDLFSILLGRVLGYMKGSDDVEVSGDQADGASEPDFVQYPSEVAVEGLRIGTAETFPLYVRSRADETKTYSLMVFCPPDANCQEGYTPMPDATWVKFYCNGEEVETIEVAPGDTKEIEVRIDVPADNDWGGQSECWIGVYAQYEEQSGVDVVPVLCSRLLVSAGEADSGGGLSTAMIAGIVGGSVLVAALLGLSIWRWGRRKPGKGTGPQDWWVEDDEEYEGYMPQI